MLKCCSFSRSPETNFAVAMVHLSLPWLVPARTTSSTGARRCPGWKCVHCRSSCCAWWESSSPGCSQGCLCHTSSNRALPHPKRLQPSIGAQDCCWISLSVLPLFSLSWRGKKEVNAHFNAAPTLSKVVFFYFCNNLVPRAFTKRRVWVLCWALHCALGSPVKCSCRVQTSFFLCALAVLLRLVRWHFCFACFSICAKASECDKRCWKKLVETLSYWKLCQH